MIDEEITNSIMYYQLTKTGINRDRLIQLIRYPHQFKEISDRSPEIGIYILPIKSPHPKIRLRLYLTLLATIPAWNFIRAASHLFNDNKPPKPGTFHLGPLLRSDFSAQDYFLVGKVLALLPIDTLDITNGFNYIISEESHELLADCNNVSSIQFKGSKLSANASDIAALARMLKKSHVKRIAFTQCQLEKWDEETFVAFARLLNDSKVEQVDFSGNEFNKLSIEQLRGFNALIQVSAKVKFLEFDTLISQLDAAFEVHLNKNTLQQNVAVTFLSTLRNLHEMRVNQLLLKFPATTRATNELYGRYFDQSYIEARLAGASAKAALMNAIKFGMDSENKYVPFASNEQKLTDSYLLRALELEVKQGNVTSFTTNQRWYFWVLFLLNILANLNSTAIKNFSTLQSRIFSKLPSLTTHAFNPMQQEQLFQLWCDLQFLLKESDIIDNKHLLRTWRYVILINELAENERQFALMAQRSNFKNALENFLESLPLCLDRAFDLINYSPEHTQQFDMFLGKTCGFEVKALTECARLGLLRYLICRNWFGSYDEVNSSAFFSSNKVVNLKNTAQLTPALLSQLQEKEKLARKEIASLTKEDLKKWEPLLRCVEQLSENSAEYSPVNSLKIY